MRFLIATIPSAGHFNPTVPIARELRDLGHEVVYASGRSMEATVHALGFQFAANPYTGPGGDVEDEIVRRFARSHGPVQLLAIARIINRAAPGMARGMMGVIEAVRPDAMLVDVNATSAWTAAEKMEIPWAASSEFPGEIYDPGYPPYIGLGLPSPATRWNRFRWRAAASLSRPLLRWSDRRINALRRGLGLPARDYNLIVGPLSPYLYLAYTIEELEYGRRHWPPQVHLVGPSLWDGGDGSPAPAWMEGWIASGVPLVYATLGTMQGGLKGKRFFDAVTRAVAGRPYNVIITTGSPEDEGRPGPAPNVRIAGYIPQGLILPHCKAAITQGGFSTSLGALSHGVPLLLAPVWGDQFENARRYVEAGVGATLGRGIPSPVKIRRSLERLLADGEVAANARKVGALLRAKDGPERASRLLIRMAETRAPVFRESAAS